MKLHPFFASPIRSAVRSCRGMLAGLALAMAMPFAAHAHNLDQRFTYINLDPETLDMMRARVAANQPALQVGDTIGVVLKSTPGPGTLTGVGGYLTFYLPTDESFQVVGAEYLANDPDRPGYYMPVPIKGQSIIAVGSGPIGPASTPGLASGGVLSLGPNILGVTEATVTEAGVHRGTIAGVYADTGIFYSTSEKTAWESWTNVTRPYMPGGVTRYPAYLTNNRGESIRPRTYWDAAQLIGFGLSSPHAPATDPNGRGSAPWGTANVVAGPQSGYAWDFDLDQWVADGWKGYSDPLIKNTLDQVGPWNRIKYPGSQVSHDQAGLVSAVLGYAGEDASNLGYDLSQANPLPKNTTAVRFSFGMLELGRTEMARVYVKVYKEFTTCPFPIHGDAFGGDAGGEQGGKDHLWRYYDPTDEVLDVCGGLQKKFSQSLVAPGSTVGVTLTYFNGSHLPAINLVVTDPLPSGISYVAGSSKVNGVVTAPTATSPMTWNLGFVEPYGMVDITFDVLVSGAGDYFNVATATSDQGTSHANDSLKSAYDDLLLWDKYVSPSAVAPGGTVNYTIEIDNNGTGPNGVPFVITEYLPTGFTYVSIVSKSINGALLPDALFAVNAANPNQPIFTINQGIQAGKSLILTFKALVSPDAPPGTYCNSFRMTYEGKVLSSPPDACVNVGGGSIGDTVWRDWDGDGTQDTGEEGIQGVTVNLYSDTGTTPGVWDAGDTLLATQVTDANGYYDFTGLTDGKYVVVVNTSATGLIQHSNTGDPDGGTLNQAAVTLANNSGTDLIDFGYKPAGTGAIQGNVYEDNQVGGTANDFDVTDPDIDAVTVNLYEDTNGNGIVDDGDLLIATDVTDANGGYSFTGLAAGLDYIVDLAETDADLAAHFAPNAYMEVTGADSLDPRAVSDLSGTVPATEDFGFLSVLPASVGDTVFFDTDGDGLYTAGSDLPLAGIKVSLYYDSNGDGVAQPEEFASAQDTDATGFYQFGGLTPERYIVVVDSADADLPGSVQGLVPQYVVTLSSGQNYLTADFPFVELFTKTADKEAALPGDIITYTLNLNLPGDQLYQNLTVCDPVPSSDVTLVGASVGGYVGAFTQTAGVPGVDPGSGTVTLTADNTNSKDTWLNLERTTRNYGADTTLKVDSEAAKKNRALLQFNSLGLPANATVSSASLALKFLTINSTLGTIVHRVATGSPWDEGTVVDANGIANWTARQTGPVNWTTAGGDFVTDTSDQTVNVTAAGTYSWSVGHIVSLWHAGTANNNGFLIKAATESGGNNVATFAGSENATAADRPVLTINYATPSVTRNEITLSKSSVVVGEQFTVTMTLSSSAAMTGVTPGALTVTGTGGASATYVSGPSPASQNIGAGGTVAFTWVYQASGAAGSVKISGTASGTVGATPYTFVSATSATSQLLASGSSGTVCWNLGSHTQPADGVRIAGASLYAFKGGDTAGGPFWKYDPTAGAWNSPTDPTDFGATVNGGGALATDGTYIYALQGDGTKVVKRYDPTANTWAAMPSLADNVGNGGAIAYHAANGKLYALRGAKQKTFSQFTFTGPLTGTWIKTIAQVPANVGDGGALVSVGNYLYALRGDSQKSFYRYDPAANSGNGAWLALANTPGNVDDGGALVAVGNYIYAFQGKTATFWRYDIAANVWTTMTAAPAIVGPGAALAAVGDYIFALRGNSTGTDTEFWRYSIAANAWTVRPSAPAAVGWGGSLVKAGASYEYSAALDVSPAIVTSGNNVTVTYNVTASENVSNFQPPATLTVSSSGGGAATYLNGPTPSGATSLSAHVPKSFTYTYKITAGTPPTGVTFSVPQRTSGTSTAQPTGVVWPLTTAHNVIAVPTLTMQVKVVASPVGALVDNVATVSGADKKELDFCYVVADGSGSATDIDVLLKITEGGTVERIGVTGTTHSEALVYSPDYTKLYTTDRDATGAAGSDRFGTLDMVTGAFTPIGRLASTANLLEGFLPGNVAANFSVLDVDGMSFNPLDGKLYAIHRREDATAGNTLIDLLFVINPVTGQHVEDAFGPGKDYIPIRTDLLATPLYDIDDIAFKPGTSELYAIANDTTAGIGDGDHLVKITLTTGALTDLGRIQRATDNANIDDVEGLTFSSNGTLHAITGGDSGQTGNYNTYWIINPTTAKASLTGYANLNPITDPAGNVFDFEALACYSDDIPIDATDNAITSLKGAIGDLVWADVNGDDDYDPTFAILGGKIDINNNGAEGGTINGNDDGILGSYRIIDGMLDLDGDGSITVADDGSFQGIAVVDGVLQSGTSVLGETGIAGVVVYIDTDNDGVLDWNDGNGNGVWDSGEGEQWTVTDANGEYWMYGFTSGTYNVRYVPDTTPTGYVPTTATSVSANLPDNHTQFSTADFGLQPGLPLNLDSTLGDLVWVDRNENGSFDTGDEAIANVTVKLYLDNGTTPGVLDSADTQIGTNVTDANGNYLFAGLNSGSYLVQVDETDPHLPPSLALTSSSPAQPNPEAVTLGVAEDKLTVDFAYNYTASIGDTVWYDNNGNGLYEPGLGENGVPGAFVMLYEDTNGNGVFDGDVDVQVGGTQTAANGTYLFDNLPADTYFVQVYEQSVKPEGCTTGCSYFQLPTTDTMVKVELDPNEAYTAADFGFKQGSTIEGSVFHDINHDSVYEPTQPGAPEPGLAGITVWIDDGDGVLEWTDSPGGNGVWDEGEGEQWTVTDASGDYKLFVTQTGNYLVTYDVNDPQIPAGLQGPAAPTTPTSLNVIITVLGEQKVDIDFGRDNTGLIGDLVFGDRGTTGTYDGAATDPGLANVVVELYVDTDSSGSFDPANDGYLATTVTDANGNYLFPGLPDGTYFVRVLGASIPLAWQTTPTVDPTSPLDGIGTANVTGGAAVVTIDFGYPPQQPGSITGSVFNDGGNTATGNGEFDYAIIDGKIDLDRNGVISAADTGTYGGYAVVAGLVDVDGDGIAGETNGQDNITLANGGLYGIPILNGYFNPDNDANTGELTDDATLGYVVVDGKLDINRDGAITTDDDGAFRGYTVIDGLVDTSGNGTVGTEDVLANLAGYPIKNGYFDIDGDTTTNGDTGDDGSVAGDTKIPAVTINLYDSTGALVASTATDANGFYRFDGLRPGTYTVEEVDPAGTVSVTDTQLDTSDPEFNLIATTVTAGATSAGNDFLDDATYLAPLSGQVRNDTDVDGNLADAESGINGVTIRLFKDLDGDGTTPLLTVIDGKIDVNGDGSITAADTATLFGLPILAGQVDVNNDGSITVADDLASFNGVQVIDGLLDIVPGGGVGTSDDGTIGTEPLIATTTTAGNGNYSFANLTFGDYVVVETDPAAAVSTNDKTNDPLGPTGTDNQVGVALSFGGETGNDFLDALTGSVDGYIYADTNGNGVKDGGESYLAGVDVLIEDSSGRIFTVTTDVNGHWTATVPPGQTTASVVVTDPQFTAAFPNGYVQTDGTDPTTVVAVGGSNVPMGNDGYFSPTTTSNPGSIAGTVYNDNDLNGFGGTDVPIAGAIMDLYLDTNGDRLVPFYTITDGLIATYTGTILDYSVIGGKVDIDGNGSITAADDGFFNGIAVVDGRLDLDADGNGTVPDSDDDGVVAGEPLVAQTATGAAGAYSFTGLPPANYVVVEHDPAGATSVDDRAAVTEFPGANTDNQIGVELSAAETSVGNDFLDSGDDLYSIGGTVWNDTDKTGGFSTGDTPVSGVTVAVYADINGDGWLSPSELASGPIQTKVTDASGNYNFPGLANGKYVVRETDPTGVTSVTDTDGNSINGPNDIGVTVLNAHVTHRDFLDDGATPVVIGDYLWLDEDGDGTQDAGEAGIANVRVELYDAAGTTLLATTYTDANGGYLFANAAAGVTYTVKIATTGAFALPGGLAANPTYDLDGAGTAHTTLVTAAFGSEGNFGADFGYNWAPTSDVTGNTNTGAIGDRLWIDANDNGIQDAGEAGLGGVSVALITAGPDGLFGTGDDVTAATTTTTADGNYAFDGLSAGAYQVVVNGGTTPTGYTLTTNGDPDGTADNKTTAPIVLGPGDVYVNADFGYVPSAGHSIGNLVFFDLNGDGFFDADGADNNAGTTADNEYGIAGVTVALYDGSANVIATAITDASGAYTFPGLPNGSYSVKITDTANVLAGLTHTTGTANTDNHSQAIPYAVTLSGASVNYADFGYKPSDNTPASTGPGVIGDTIFLDRNGTGGQDLDGADNIFGTADDEPGIEGVTLYLYDSTGTTLLATTATDENGHYAFAGLADGAYQVRVATATLPGALSDPLANSFDPDAGTASQSLVTLTGGAANLDQDFGYRDTTSPNTIAGTVWNDSEANGVLESGESGRYAGVTVVLRDSNGDIVATAVTDATGNYTFNGLPDGTYTVDVTDANNVLDGLWHSLGTPNADNNSQTDPYTVTLAGGQTADADFGYYGMPAALGDFVWDDVDGNGVQGTGEPGLAGVQVTLTISWPNAATTTLKTTTDASGLYRFDNLILDEQYDGAGTGEPTFSLAVATPSDYAPTLLNHGGDDTKDSENPAGQTAAVSMGTYDDTFDFGFVSTEARTISGTVYADTDNSNGFGGDTPLAGVVVQLWDKQGTTLIAETVTGIDGHYEFTGVQGSAWYTIKEVNPTGFTSVTDIDGLNDDSISVQVKQADVTGQDFLDNNAVSILRSIGGLVYDDGGIGVAGADNTFGGSPADAPLPGVHIALYRDLDSDGVADSNEHVATTVTDANGAYTFNNLPQGSYLVVETDPSGAVSEDDVSTDDPNPGTGGDVPSDTDNEIAVLLGASNVTGQNFLDDGAQTYDISGTVLNDTDRSATFTGTDTPLAGVTVKLYADLNNNGAYDAGLDSLVATTLTDGNGDYTFPDLPNGSYLVVEIDPAGATSVTDALEPDAATDDNTIHVQLSSSDSTGNDFLDVAPTYVIGDRVWLDEDADGVQDAGESGIANVAIRLYDSTGTVLLATTVTDAQGGYLFTDLAAGTYTVKVDTTSMAAGLAANPTFDKDLTLDHQTSVTVGTGEGVFDADFGYDWATKAQVDNNTGVGAIGDRVWVDANGNGTQDPGEPGLGGVTVTLLNAGADGIFGTGDDTAANTTTAADGSYVFDGLAAGAYQVSVTAGTTGYSQTGDPDEPGTVCSACDAMTTTPILLAPGDVYVNADFGYQPTGNSGTVSGTAWFDANANAQGPTGTPGGTESEPTIAGVTVALVRDLNGNGAWDAGETIVATTATDASGNYAFTGLPANGTEDYLVWVNDTANVLAGLVPTYDNNGTTTPNLSAVANLTTSGNNLQDFGYTAAGQTSTTALIGDTVFLDRNNNGAADPGEGLEGVTVGLYQSDGITLIATTVTDENGHYAFGGLAAGTYVVKVDTTTLPGTADPLTNTKDPDNTAPLNESIVTLTSGQIDLTQDFGYQDLTSPNTITGTVWSDTNGDGVLSGETGVFAGVTIVLRDGQGDVVATTTTDAYGNYSFTGLPDGTYTVDVTDEANVLNGLWHSAGTAGLDNNSQTDPYTVAVANNNGGSGYPADFGYFGEPPAALGDWVWADDGDGIQETGELGLAGVVVQLTITWPDTTTLVYKTVTDASGHYYLGNLMLDENLAGATYSISIPTLPGTASPQNAAAENLDSDNPAGESATVTRGAFNGTYDFGFYNTAANTATIAGAVYDDGGFGAAGNGGLDATDAPVPGVTVWLYLDLDDDGTPQPGELVGCTVTAADGSYSFPNLVNGNYLVVESNPSAASSVTDADGTGNGADLIAVTLTGTDVAGMNFLDDGTTTTSLGGHVYDDGGFGATGNGAFTNDGQTNPDAPIPGVWITLYRDVDGDGIADAGELVDTTVTAADGSYSFPNLPSGDYLVVETDPTGVTSIDDTEGVNTDNKVAVPLTGTPSTGNDFLDDGGTGTYTYTIGGAVKNDADLTGSFSAGDTILSGVTVTLYADLNNNGVVDAGDQWVATQTTDASGNYSFPNIPNGSYLVVETDPSGFVSVTDSGEPDAANNANTIDVAVNGANSTANNFLDRATGQIGNYVWLDENGDGVQDAGEAGIANLTVALTGTDAYGNGVNLTTTTDANGGYLFSHLPPSDGTGYTVTVMPTAGLNATYNEDTGTTLPDNATKVVLAAGADHATADFGYNWAPTTDVANGTGTGAIGDRIWNDADGDGMQDMAEAGLGGVQVTLTKPGADGILGTIDDTTTTTTTAADGTYVFDGLPAGAYAVQVNPTTLPAGFNTAPSGDPDGVLDGIASPIVLAPGDVYVNADFGYKLDTDSDPSTGTDAPGGSTIGDMVFFDANGDGVFDADGTDNNLSTTADNEYGIRGVSVALLDASGNVIATTRTGLQGWYEFNGLPAGTYTVWVNDTFGVLSELRETADPDALPTDTPGLDSRDTLTVYGTSDYLDEDFGYTVVSQVLGRGIIGDNIFFDANANGIRDSGGVEDMANVTVRLYDNTTGALVGTAVTDPNGRYYFADLPAGTYRVEVDPGSLPPGMVNSIDPDGGSANQSVVTISAGEVNLAQDFGYAYSGTYSSITGTLWNDADADGYLDATETTRFANVLVVLRDNTGDIIAKTWTDANGDYAFGYLPNATYTVDVVDEYNVLDGLWHSTGAAGVDGYSQLDPYTVTVSGGTYPADFGYYGFPAALGDRVWNDLDSDGIQDGAETGIAGVVVQLTITWPGNPTPTVVQTVTDANGYYAFDNLLLDENYDGVGSPEPTYSVSIPTLPGTASPTGQGTPATDANDPSGTTATLVESFFDVTYDFGFYNVDNGTATISGMVYDDNNTSNDNVIGADDLPQAGVVVAVYRDLNNDGIAQPGELVATALTGADGSYSFPNLANGDYLVIESDPIGATSEYDTQGSPTDNKIAVTLTGTDSSGNNFLDDGAPLASLSGSVYDDSGFEVPGDEAFGGTPSDDPIPGVLVALYLDLNNDGIAQPGELVDTTATASDGSYTFPNLPSGDYLVIETDPSGATSIDDTEGADTDNKVAVTLAGTPSTANNFLDDGTTVYPVAGTVYDDADQNDSFSVGDTPLSGVTVALYADLNNNGVVDAGDTLLETDTTDGSGMYSFANIPNGNYLVVETDPSGYQSVTDSGEPDLNNDDNTIDVWVNGAANSGNDFLDRGVPDITPVITALPNVMIGVTEYEIYVRCIELKGIDTTGLITLRIPKDPRWTMHLGWKPAMTQLPVSGIPVQNPLWTHTEDANTHIFTTTTTIVGSSQATFGFEAKWDAGQTRGSYTISVAIVPWSGGEDRINNNNDSETVDYSF